MNRRRAWILSCAVQCGAFKDLNDKGTTIILTTHYLEEAEMLCRNIGIIQHGELVENTSMKGLLSKLKSETFILDLAEKPAAKTGRLPIPAGGYLHAGSGSSA